MVPLATHTDVMDVGHEVGHLSMMSFDEITVGLVAAISSCFHSVHSFSYSRTAFSTAGSTT